jgi:hypothetical protein
MLGCNNFFNNDFLYTSTGDTGTKMVLCCGIHLYYYYYSRLLKKEVYNMNYEELLESVRNIEGEDAKEQIIAILEKWENPDKQKLTEMQETIDKQNNDLARYEIRVDELRKFNAEKLLNTSTDGNGKEPEVDDCSLEDIIDSF